MYGDYKIEATLAKQEVQMPVIHFNLSDKD
jgi:hypothetical protein